MTSIARLLTVGVIGSLLLAGIAIGKTANWLLDSALHDYMINDLQNESRRLLTAIKRGPNGVMIDSADIDPAYKRPLSGRYFVVSAGQQQWRSRSLWDEQLAPLDGQTITPQLVDGPRGQRLLWLDSTYQRYGMTINVLMALDYSPILQDIQQIRQLLLASGIAVLVLLALLQQLLVRRSLRPLELARAQIEQLRSGAITTMNDEVPAELAPLIHEINRLLGDTQQQLHRSRVALGDLSHSLKTPLAVLLNLAERDAIRQDPALRNALITQIEQIRQRITREMAHARTAGSNRAQTLFDMDSDLPLLLQSMRQIHRDRVTVECEITLAGKIPWEREDILEVLGNLLDNACKWSRAHVRLTMRRDKDRLLIQVDDDGPGIPQAQRPTALQRGERLDESVTGHGLGLAIVADKVSAYQGLLTFSSSEQGGLSAHIQLPWH